MGTGGIKISNDYMYWNMAAASDHEDIKYYATEQGARIAFGKYRKKIGYNGLKMLILQECTL
jgi:hypothetical protein